MENIEKKFYYIRYFLYLYPWKSVFIVTALLITGLAEALSFADLIPLLSITFFKNNSSGDVDSSKEFIYDILNFLNIETELISLLVIISILVIFKSSLSFYSMKEIGYICANIEKDFRKKISNNLLTAKWSYFQNNKTGNFSSAIGMQVQKAANIIRAAGLVTAGLIQVVFYSLIAFTISPTITSFGILAGCVIMFFLKRYVTLAKKSSEIMSNQQGILLSRLIDSLRGVKSNKAMGLEERLLSYLNKDIEILANTRKKIVLSSAVLKNLQEPFIAITISISLFFLLSSWTNSFESLMVLILIFYRMGMRIGHLQVYYQQIATALPHLKFVLNIIASAKTNKEDITTGNNINSIKNIEFKNVNFSHQEVQILNDVSFKINSGEFVSIVGPSGSGKTTLIDMLLAFHKPSSGTINFNQIDLELISKKDIRNIIGYLPQETILFNDTIKNNITFGDKQISDEKIYNALKKSSSLEFIDNFNDGLEFNVGEHGSRLSGGQKQRIGIARALLNDPSVLILDEPTSALDDKSEQEILAVINNLKGKVITIAVSHKDIFIKAADRTLLLKKGRISE